VSEIENTVRQYVSKMTSDGNLYHRESNTLEYKESFGHKSWATYLKCIASFANNKGGTIVFGVKDKPNTPIGIKQSIIQDIDPATVTKHLQDHFDPEINYEIGLIEADGKWFGFFHIEEAQNKPVICKKNAGKEINEGDIYYRYRGRSEKIKFGELRTILDDINNKKENDWFHLLRSISQAGTQNVQILDLKNGKIGDNVFIDEDTMGKIRFIKEGQFSEKEGAPTLKLIGEIKGDDTKAGIIKEKEVKVYEDIDKTHPYVISQIFTELSQEFTYIKQYYLDPFVKTEEIKSDNTLCRSLSQGKRVFYRYSEKLKEQIREKILSDYPDAQSLLDLQKKYKKQKNSV